MSRPLHAIAAEIQNDWRKPYFGAVPYLRAMHALDGISDAYGADSARTIVAYFLGNAGAWRGTVARRVKLELRSMLESGL